MTRVAASAGERVRADLDPLIERDESLWRALRGARVFMTGGTGFVGKWLLESFVHANECLGLGMRAAVLSRDPGAFGATHPRLFGASGIEWVRATCATSTLLPEPSRTRSTPPRTWWPKPIPIPST